MYEATKMLNCGMIILLLSLGYSVFSMILFHRKKTCDEYDNLLQKNAKRFSSIPFAFNICLLALFLALSIIQFILAEEIIIISFFIILLGAAVSAAFGPSVEAMGLFFSICFAAKYKRKGVKYIVFSAVSLIISLCILIIWLVALVPLALRYYGL